MRTRTNTRTGFTLIEAIIAIVILSTAIPAMFWAIRDAHTRRANPVLAAKARWLAAEKLEDVIADRHSSTRGWSYVASGNYAAEPAVSGFAGFSRATSIAEKAANLTSAGTGYKVVTVTVSYTDLGGQSRSVQIATVLTEYTP